MATVEAESEPEGAAATEPKNMKGLTKTMAFMAPNDEVERRGASPASNEGTLSQPSTPSLAHRIRQPPRSLEPFVRGRSK